MHDDVAVKVSDIVCPDETLVTTLVVNCATNDALYISRYKVLGLVVDPVFNQDLLRWT